MVGYAKAIIILWCAMWSWSIELKLCRYHGANFVHWMCFVNGRMWFYLFVWSGNHRTMADSSFLCSTSLLVIAFWEWQFNNLAHATTHGTISASIAMCVCAVMRCNHRKIIVAGTNVTGVRCYAGGPSVKQVQTVEQLEFFASAFFFWFSWRLKVTFIAPQCTGTMRNGTPCTSVALKIPARTDRKYVRLIKYNYLFKSRIVFALTEWLVCALCGDIDLLN